MAIVKTLGADGSKGHHKFSLRVSEDSTSGNSSFLSYTFSISPIQNGYDWNSFGSAISYSITIGSNTYTGTIPAYNGSTVVTLKSGNNIEIAHNSDGTKTINIGFSVTDSSTASYTCGTASASDTFKLTDLHKAPILSITNLQENYSGISDDVFVRWVSNKTFTVSYSFYDSATPSSLKIYTKSGVEIASVATLNTSTGTLQMVGFDIKESDVTNGKTFFILELIDNKGGKARITTPDYNVVLYFNPSLIPTSSFVKRAGQTTGEANITLIGTFFNDYVGSAQNSIVMKFDFWKIDDTEPIASNYRYTIPSSANTGTGNNIEITNWKLKNGNTIINTLDEEYAYIIGVTLTDNKTGLLNVYKFNLPKGVWLMAKFKDHVDFMNVTINQNPIIENGNNANGEYIKYYDGTMICTKKITNESNSITNQWGNMYESASAIDLGDMPQTFTSISYINVSITSNSYHCWIIRHADNTLSDFGNLYLGRPTSATITVDVNCIAIGKWK